MPTAYLELIKKELIKFDSAPSNGDGSL